MHLVDHEYVFNMIREGPKFKKFTKVTSYYEKIIFTYNPMKRTLIIESGDGDFKYQREKIVKTVYRMAIWMSPCDKNEVRLEIK